MRKLKRIILEKRAAWIKSRMEHYREEYIACRDLPGYDNISAEAWLRNQYGRYKNRYERILKKLETN